MRAEDIFGGSPLDFEPLKGINLDEQHPSPVGRHRTSKKKRNLHPKSTKTKSPVRLTPASSRSSSKKKQKKKKKTEDLENHRPESDRYVFNNIQQQKYFQRNSLSNQYPTMAPSNKRKNRELKEMNDKLEQQVAALRAQVASKPTRSALSPSEIIVKPFEPTQAEKAAVKQAGKNLYHNYKFVKDEVEAKLVTSQAIKLMKLDFQSDEEKATWIYVHQETVVKAISDGRNYTQQRYREAAIEWLNENQDLPSVEDITKAAKRELDLDDADERKIFFWYWEILMERAHASNDWSRVMYNTTISKAVLRDYPGMKTITSAMEAFAVVMYDNCRKKWIAMKDWLDNNPGQKLPQRTKDNKNLDIFQSKWSHQDGGQQPYGGWDAAAKETFNVLKEEIRELRSRETTWQYEEKALKLLRDEREMDKKDGEKKKTNKKNGSKKRKLVDTFDDVME